MAGKRTLDERTLERRQLVTSMPVDGNRVHHRAFLMSYLSLVPDEVGVQPAEELYYTLNDTTSADEQLDDIVHRARLNVRNAEDRYSWHTMQLVAKEGRQEASRVGKRMKHLYFSCVIDRVNAESPDRYTWIDDFRPTLCFYLVLVQERATSEDDLVGRIGRIASHFVDAAQEEHTLFSLLLEVIRNRAQEKERGNMVLRRFWTQVVAEIGSRAIVDDLRIRTLPLGS
ncbi:hypothetical protein C8A00DRAFT_36762 [Chaetomidium leptoderma]|uniref:Uncharacterized protein n=1 Tax=Chaetomidium leptoderma TaxID=669021 RepID=A0AAN6VFS1_9PEZI|nr:hypothetical protein C8A00DRAFT_36762 [Chaetomidium leptoderma]